MGTANLVNDLWREVQHLRSELDGADGAGQDLTTENERMKEIAERMANAIREWNRAKQEREQWRPVIGQVPPVGILGSAKKANQMLTDALNEYDALTKG